MAIIETERLRIRPFTTEDAAFALEMVNQPAYLRYVGDRGVRTLEDAERYLTEGPIRGYERNGFGLCLAERKEDGTPIGCCGLIQREALEDVDIGFALLPSYEGQGYAFEAASATMAYGRNVLKLKRIVAIVTPDNARSIRLLERLGLSYERRITWADDGVELSVYAWGEAAP